jgi:S-adenosylmethionine hydrolase
MIARMGVIALLTDFGLADPYVGMMKGVILGIAPETAIVDVTHEVPPQDVRAGAFFLAQAARHFPSGTVYVAVVDPGVGGARRALAVAAGGQIFVGPDNGLLDPALSGRGAPRAVEIREPRYLLPVRSSTFHGRDVFAPAAAHLVRGLPLSSLGPRATRLVSLRWPVVRAVGRGERRGEILHVDRFGNLITNFAPADVPRGATLRAGTFTANRLHRTYLDAAPGALVALVSSYGLVEIAVRDGSAAARLGLGRGDEVRVTSPRAASRRR